MSAKKGLVERLQGGEHILIAEGYMWELEHRGYVSAGAFTPEVVIDHPEVVRTISEEFVHAGSDIVEAFTYYGHRAKMRTIEREDELTTLNKQALRIAREVADSHGKLMAGGLSNSTVFVPNDKQAAEKVEEIFKEQIEWAVDGGADLIICETFQDYGEAALALHCVQKYGMCICSGLPAVVTLQPTANDVTYDGVQIEEACRQLEEAGAAVVGLNCSRGPETMLPTMRKIRKACKGPIACLPVPYRTTIDVPSFQDLMDQKTGMRSFPIDTDPWSCSRSDIRQFAKDALAIGIQYLGLCCGNRAIFMREIAEELGRTPPASKYRPDMTKHISQLTDEDHKHVQARWTEDYITKISRDPSCVADDTT